MDIMEVNVGDIMIHADEDKIILINLLLFGRCHFFNIFQVKVFG